MGEGGIGDGADRTGLLLRESGMGRGQMGVDGPDDGTGGIGDAVLGVGVLERGAGQGVHGFFLVVRHAGRRRVVVQHVAVVLDLGVGHGASGFVVLGDGRVVRWEHVGGGTDHGTDCGGGHDGIVIYSFYSLGMETGLMYQYKRSILGVCL